MKDKKIIGNRKDKNTDKIRDRKRRRRIREEGP